MADSLVGSGLVRRIEIPASATVGIDIFPSHSFCNASIRVVADGLTSGSWLSGLWGFERPGMVGEACSPSTSLVTLHRLSYPVSTRGHAHVVVMLADTRG